MILDLHYIAVEMREYSTERSVAMKSALETFFTAMSDRNFAILNDIDQFWDKRQFGFAGTEKT